MKELKNPREIEGISFKVYPGGGFFVCVSELHNVFVIFDSEFRRVPLGILLFSEINPELKETLILVGILEEE